MNETKMGATLCLEAGIREGGKVEGQGVGRRIDSSAIRLQSV